MKIIEQLDITLADVANPNVPRVKVHEKVKAVDFYDGYVIVTREDDETFTLDMDNIVAIKG